MELTVPLPNVPTLGQIQALEALLAPMPQVEIPVEHLFADGMYARKITIPAGTVLTGKVHRTDHINVMLSGDIEVWTEQGMKRLVGPQVFVAKAGTKRVGRTFADTVWITFHASKETDLLALEAELIEPEIPAIEGVTLWLG